MKLFAGLLFLLSVFVPDVLFAENNVPDVPKAVSGQAVIQKRIETMQYVFNYTQMAYSAQKLRPIKQNMRKARRHLEKVFENSPAEVENPGLDDQIRNNRITLAAQEVNRSIDQVLSAKNVADARQYARKAMQEARSIAYPETHSLFEVDLDYDNLLRSH